MKPVSRCPETVRRKTGSPAAKRALPPEMKDCVEAGSTCAMSSRQASSAASELARLRRHRQRAVLADHRDADRAGVEPLGVRSDDVLLDPAVAALVDGAEAVDEEVVADVVPAVPLHVVELDRLHDRGRLGRGVPVRARGVVDDREPQVGRERGSRAPDLLVRLPAGARHDRRRTCLLQRPRGDAGRGARDEPGPQAADLPAQPVLDPVGAPDPPWVAEPPAVRTGPLGGARVRPVLGLRRRVLPGAPAARRRARPELHRARAAPVQPDEIEAGRSARGSSRALSGKRDIARDDRRLLGQSGRRQGEDESDEDEQAF